MLNVVTLLILSFLVVPEASANFTRTTLEFKMAKNSEVNFSFEYKNLTSGPAIISLIGKSSDGGKCSVTSFTKEPIFSGGSGYVHVRCRFWETGYHRQQITTAVVSGKNGPANVPLWYKAQIYEDNSYKLAKNPQAKARANHCQNLDLNNSYPLSTIPVSDQDGTGMCYAHATSTLLEYELKQKGINRTLSTVDLGFVMKSITGKYDDTLNGGLFDNTVLDAISQGVATKECVDGIIKKETVGTTMNQENFIHLVNEIYKLKAKKKTAAQIETELKSLCGSYGVDHNEFLNLMNDLKVPLRTYFLKLLRPCELERKQAKNWKIQKFDEISEGNHLDYVNKLDSILNSKKPAGIALCAEILWGQSTHQGVISPSRTLKYDAKGNRQCAAHAVVVTARKNENGSCKYMVRNSWGSSWQGKGLTCACRTPKSYYQDCKSVPKAQSGNKVVVGCWVPEKTLMDNTYIIGGIK